MLARKGAVGVEVDGKALAGVEQLDEHGRIGAERGDVLRPEIAIASRSRRPSGSVVSPSGAESRIVVVEPTQSSGTWSPAIASPRNRAIASPPR